MSDKTTYNPNMIEAYWRDYWESHHYFKPSGQGQPYCLLLPPPNVTGSLHMGHGFQVTLMDALARYHRMCGKNVLWQGGTDHAGIATQMLVERQLLAQGKTRHILGREAFLTEVWKWKEKSGDMISQQLRRMGASIDWSRERFTYDPGFSAAVKKAFITLYQQGLIYRGKRLVNWDPLLLTAISDLEVIHHEEQGHLWTIRYPLLDNDGFLSVSTTRPETLLGDVAVAVHPDDVRFQHYIGKHIKLPLTQRIIPIIADDSIDPTFASGCVKITPAHDFNDCAIAQRHQLPSINVLTPNAHLNDSVPIVYRGLERFAARQRIIHDLKQQGLLEKIESHRLKIPRGDRSGSIIEPYLTDQWFVATKTLAQPALQAIQKKQLDFFPEAWQKICLQWLENIEDWCISRQLWWGHRIPAWFDKKGQIYIGENEETVREHYALDPNQPLKQDEDVLDTWFSSALWPLATLGWPADTKELRIFYPTSILVTGFDILFFWVARMLMFGLHFKNQVPFKEVYITGLIRDHEGQKMSKSKGNVLDPLDIIQGIPLDGLLAKRCQDLLQPQVTKKIVQTTREQFPHGISAFGTDALRFTYCALASPTRDIHFDLNRTEGYRNFCNKLWNAGRFLRLHTKNKSLGSLSPSITFSIPINRAFYSHLQTTISEMHHHFKIYRFDLMAQTIYEFIWNQYCDWYLELAKPRLLDPSQPDIQQETLVCLIRILEICLRLLHPLIPFITEEIWQSIAPLLGKTGPTLLLQTYPLVDETKKDLAAEQDLAWLKAIVQSIRTIRSETGIAPGKKIPLLLYKADDKDKMRLSLFQHDIFHLAKISSMHPFDEKKKTMQPMAMGFVETLQLLIPITGLIDTTAEIKRLEKEAVKLKKEIDRIQTKLGHIAFIQKAPTKIVEQERQRLADFLAKHSQVKKQLAQLQKSENTR